MWAAVIGFLLQVALEVIKAWIRDRDDAELATSEVTKLADEALRTGNARPLRDYIAKLRAERQGRR